MLNGIVCWAFKCKQELKCQFDDCKKYNYGCYACHWVDGA